MPPESRAASASEWLLAGVVAALGAVAANASLLFDNHIILTVDFFTHYRWAAQFHQSLSEGVLYPRWASAANDGFGEPAFVYYPPLYFYFTSWIQFLGCGLWASMKIVATAAAWLAGLAGFAIARRAAGLGWALAAGLLVQGMPFLSFTHGYLNAFPWHASAPFVLWMIYATLHPARGWIDWRLSLALALLAMTHVLTAFMALLCLPWVFLAPEARRTEGGAWVVMGRWCLSVGAGLLLAMPYLLPALTTWRYIQPNAWYIPALVDWRNAFAFPIVTSRVWGLRWFAIQWVLAGSALILAAFATVVAVHLARRRALVAPGVVPLLCAAWVALLFTSELSYPLFATFSSLRKVQYPYRFLAIAAPAATLAGILTLRSIPNAWRRSWRWAMALPLAASVALLGVVQSGLHREGRTPPFSRALAGTYGALEYYTAARKPEWKTYHDSGGLDGALARAEGTGRTVRDFSHEKIWEIRVPRATTLALPLFSYPAWSLFVDGHHRPAGIDSATGLLAVPLPEGQHQVRVVWSGLVEERVGGTIGLLTAVSLVCLAFLGKARRRPKGRSAEGTVALGTS